jgi:hypothetical protein
MSYYKDDTVQHLTLTLPLPQAHFIWYCAWLSLPSAAAAAATTTATTTPPPTHICIPNEILYRTVYADNGGVHRAL